MRLDLTLQETERLRHCLTEALASHAGNPDEQALKNLLGKVVEAESRSTRQLCCRVCRQRFTGEAVGRTDLYCSAACKQKAYRQRRSAWRRQFGPNASTLLDLLSVDGRTTSHICTSHLTQEPSAQRAVVWGAARACARVAMQTRATRGVNPIAHNQGVFRNRQLGLLEVCANMPFSDASFWVRIAQAFACLARATAWINVRMVNVIQKTDQATVKMPAREIR